MHPRRLLILFVLAVLAVGGYLLLELPGRHARERSLADAARLFSFDPATVDAIELARSDDTLRFALTGTHWTMAAPLTDDAEAGAVVPIVVNIAGAEIQRDLGPAQDLARYGLLRPAVTVRLRAGADTVAVLALGDLTVDHAAVYARRGAGHVLLVPTSLIEAVTLARDDYRNRRVVVFDLAAVRAFELDSRLTGRSGWWRGRGDRWFTVIAGDTVAGDSVAVPAVLRRLRGMRVRAFPAAPDTSAPALVTVTLHKDDGSLQRVRFQPVQGEGTFLARVGGNARVVEVADDPSDIAMQSGATLRDRRVLQFDPLAARRMSFATPDTSAVLVRAGDAWALPNPALGTVDAARAADLVRALRALRFQRLWPDAPLDPRASPRFSLVIQGAGDTIIDELQCAPAPGDTTWVARSLSLGASCEVRGGALDEIARLVSQLRR